jgi:hypothetical protein
MDWRSALKKGTGLMATPASTRRLQTRLRTAALALSRPDHRESPWSDMMA